MGVLDGKVILITGGGNGIGRECALQAAAAGAKVVVNDLGGSVTGGDEGSVGPAQAVADEIKAAGGEAVANSESVTDFAAVKGMIEQAKDEFGGLHAIINPAGILRDGVKADCRAGAKAWGFAVCPHDTPLFAHRCWPARLCPGAAHHGRGRRLSR